MDEKQRQALLDIIEMGMRGENPDSLEIGTAGKGGGIKVYGNYSRPEEFKQKIDAAFEVRAYAQAKMAGEKDG